MVFTHRLHTQGSNRQSRGNDSRSNYLWTDPTRHDIRLTRRAA